MKKCSVEKCNNVVYCKTWCNKHYRKWQRLGDPLSGKFESLNKPGTKEHISENIIKRPAPYGKFYQDLIGPCWIWQQSLDKDGYGKIKIKGKHIKVTKAVMIIWNFINENDNRWILHHCDITSCVNPDHLYAGTAQDNSIDRTKRGRCPYQYGERNPASKLTESECDLVKYMYFVLKINQETLSEIFNVTQTTISTIVLNKRGYLADYPNIILSVN